MDQSILFVGEKQSPLARRKGWHWPDGHVAAKQLFDALEACGIEPTQCKFANWLNTRSQAAIKAHVGPVVGMGNIVQTALTSAGITHIPIVHPAARGRIRKKERYIEHIRTTLTEHGILEDTH